MSVELPCATLLAEDITRDIIRLPQNVFLSLNLSEWDYVSIYGKKSHCVLRVRKLPKGSRRCARVRGSVRDKIGAELNDMIRVEKIEEPFYLKAKAHWAKIKDIGKEICRLNPQILPKLRITEGNLVELFNLDTGGRIVLQAKGQELMHGNPVRIEKYIRGLLNVNEETIGTKSTTELGIRKNIWKIRKEGILDQLLKLVVGYNWLMLRVVMGEDVDEGKRVVRLRKDNMALLGVHEGDMVDISWLNRKIKCRALEKTTDGTTSSRQKMLSEIPRHGIVIWLCSRERDSLDVDLYDVVKVRRNPLHVFGKNMDRAFATTIMALALYASLTTQFGWSQVWAMVTSSIVWVISLLLLFTKVRGEA